MSARANSKLRILALALTVGALVVALIAPATASACADEGADPSSASLKKIERATHCLINKQRGRRGVNKLERSAKLDQAAVGHSRDMAAKNFFSHDGVGGSLVDRIDHTGYLASSGWTVGENIAWGSGERATPGAIVKAWMNSPGHRDNILRSSFKDIGIGVARGAPTGGVDDAAVYTTDFGRH